MPQRELAFHLLALLFCIRSCRHVSRNHNALLSNVGNGTFRIKNEGPMIELFRHPLRWNRLFGRCNGFLNTRFEFLFDKQFAPSVRLAGA